MPRLKPWHASTAVSKLDVLTVPAEDYQVYVVKAVSFLCILCGMQHFEWNYALYIITVKKP